MIVYDGSDDHKLALKSWYDEMVRSDELQAAFAASVHEFDAWMANWNPAQRSLIFDIDERGMWYAVWLEPAFRGAFVSLWARSDRRTSADLDTFDQILDLAFQHFSVLMLVTRRPELVATFERFGITTLGSIPRLFDGHDAFVAYLTPEAHAVGWRLRRAALEATQQGAQPNGQ